MNAAPQMLTGICQVALASADPIALVAFYRDTLGFPVLFETNGMTFFQSGATRLMIGAGHPGQQIGGDAVLYFEPRDWSSAESALEAKGIAFLHPAQKLQEAAGARVDVARVQGP